VEIVVTYKLYNGSRTKLENLIHRIFDPARLDIEIKGRFGNPVIPREWFLVPLFAIDAIGAQGRMIDFAVTRLSRRCAYVGVNVLSNGFGAVSTLTGLPALSRLACHARPTSRRQGRAGFTKSSTTASAS
jgi:hypothetical protein